tara:strand:- start:474 stop:1037 length:564 start_codon:yes stop_codon:yes gene_type:complete
LTSIPAANITGTLPAIDGSNLTGVGGGGITYARSYRLHSSFTHTGTHTVLTNWEYSDDGSSGHIGSGWALPSSGTFSFPATGIYLVTIKINMRAASGVNNGWAGADLQVTTDNSSYDVVANFLQQVVNISDTSYFAGNAAAIIDVTDISNVKFQIKAFRDTSGGDVTFYGNTSGDSTSVKIIRLGDT